MENVKVSVPMIQDLRNHFNCELQFRESPFKDGSLMLYCLDHEEFLLGVVA